MEKRKTSIDKGAGSEERNMRLLLDQMKFRDFPGERTGLVVTFAPAPSISFREEEIHVVVGHCGSCIIKENKKSKELKELGLACPDWVASLDLVSKLYPAGTTVAGIFWRLTSDEVENPAYVEKLYDVLMETTNFKKAFCSSPPLLITISGNGSDISVKAYQLNSSKAESFKQVQTMEVLTSPVPYSLTRYLGQHATLLRLRASLPLYLPARSDVNQLFDSICTKISSNSTYFLIPSVHQLISESSSELKLKDVLPEVFRAASKQSRGNYLHGTPPVVVELLESTAFVYETWEEIPLAPTLSMGEPLKNGCFCITVPIDTLTLVDWNTLLYNVSNSLKEGICKQLHAIKDAIFWKPGTLHSVTAHHFKLDQQHCPVTIIYPNVPANLQANAKGKSLTNKDLQPLRAKWTRLLNLPPKSPLVRIISRDSGDLNQPISSISKVPGPQLLNPHLAVKHTRVKGGCLALVQGHYLYYHYMHDGFDDSGWGCAYRSLQTIWSWFLLQGYSNNKVPMHREIQTALVDVGDKEKQFAGSKEWIGSYEVSIVLNQLLGVECKIEFCPCGSSVSSTGRLLLTHFQTEGTPVMIGGGILAHTILGVDFSETSGEVEFLVLDPHYSGRDDLRTIVEKGWCAWKTVNFWDSTGHYNMCLPQISEDM